MKNKKITLGVIIILLIIFLPISIFSTVRHFQVTHAPEENPNHEFKYDGKLYFYDGNNLLGTYTCKNANNYCDYAQIKQNTVTSLIEKKIDENTTSPIIDNRFVFIMDTADEIDSSEILLYDLSINQVIGHYKEVKNYGIGIQDDYFILENQHDLWGMVYFNDGINVKLPFQYDFIGLADKIDSESNKIASDILAIRQDDAWHIIDANGKIYIDDLTSDLISYNDEYYIIKENNILQLKNFKNQVILNNNFTYLNFYNDYLEIIDSQNQFYLYDIRSTQRISNFYPVESIEDIELKTEDNQIQIIQNDEVKETVAIQ